MSESATGTAQNSSRDAMDRTRAGCSGHRLQPRFHPKKMSDIQSAKYSPTHAVHRSLPPYVIPTLNNTTPPPASEAAAIAQSTDAMIK